VLLEQTEPRSFEGLRPLAVGSPLDASFVNIRLFWGLIGKLTYCGEMTLLR
jgi:hypothetical protein